MINNYADIITNTKLKLQILTSIYYISIAHIPYTILLCYYGIRLLYYCIIVLLYYIIMLYYIILYYYIII